MTNDAISGYRIRRAEPGDTEALYEICLLTADAGSDASALYSDRRLPGYIWAAAYGALEPDFAFVLSGVDGAVGYVLAAPDTAAFENRLEREWWPRVRAELEGFTPVSAHDEAALRHITAPERRDQALLADYPAHLHINILPQAQAGGWGRRMIETELQALRAAGVKGVQLGVAPNNVRAQGFYRHLGFTDISTPGRVIYGMRLV
ncbi:MAG TPA: GNAT family N-acetyltransferase [Devosia sp.]|nr:GNAT family N-acetyltransferase [Devosia sp.]